MKTFQEFITDCNLYEGRIPWDDPNITLRSRWTPREKNRAKRISLGIENPEHTPSQRELERYGALQNAHETQRNVKTRKNDLHKNPEDYSVGRNNPFIDSDEKLYLPSYNIRRKRGDLRLLGKIKPPRNRTRGEESSKRNYGARNDEARDKYYEKGPKGLREPKR